MSLDEEERFEALYTAEAPAVLAYALRRVAEPSDAADALAETFLVAWRRLSDIPAGEDARLWLFGVARRVVLNQQRSWRRRTRLTERIRQEASALASTLPAPRDEGALVRAALERLGDDDRELIRLTSWEELTPQAIATMLGVPAGTVRSRLHRARARLRSEIERNATPAAPRTCSADEPALVSTQGDDR